MWTPGAGPSTHTQVPLSDMETAFHLHPVLPPFWMLCHSKCGASQTGLWWAQSLPRKAEAQWWFLRLPQTYVCASLDDWLLSVPEIWPLGGEEGSKYLNIWYLVPLFLLFLLFLLTQKWFFCFNSCVLRIDFGSHTLFYCRTFNYWSESFRLGFYMQNVQLWKI